jgi:hypothetical protein
VAARSYYRRRFGVVRSKSQVWLDVSILIAAVVLIEGASYVDVTTQYSISFISLWWALFYVICYRRPYGVRPFSLWFAALFLVLSFLTLMAAISKQQFFMGVSGVGEFTIWLAFSLHGLFDHLLLLRVLPHQAWERSVQRHG